MNVGKIFENEFKDSVEYHNKKTNDIYILRLTDSASGFGMDSTKTRFSAKSPYDFFLHRKNGIDVAIELKSTAGTSISFSLDTNEKMIKANQINSLLNTSIYNIKSGLLLNFRKYEKTYWISINDFINFAKNTDKKSINVNDIENYNGVIVKQKKKKIRYIYDIEYIMETGEEFE